MNLTAPISIGELYDKISILEIKSERITNPDKLKNIHTELQLLKETAKQFDVEQALYKELKEINEKLWDIEDAIRLKEKNKQFDDEFIQIARSVYIQNDDRMRVKNEINRKYNSLIVEEKSYEKYM